MVQVLINIRMDEDLKKSMEKTCNELGMNMSTAFTIFAKKMTMEKRIPFEVSSDPFYCQKNTQAIEDSIEQLRNGRIVIKTMEALEAMEISGAMEDEQDYIL